MQKLITLFAVLIVNISIADTLVLKNGLSLEGRYKGGTETSIKFETSGSVQEVAISEIKSLVFSKKKEAAQSDAPAAASAATSVSAGDVDAIPAGTKIMIKTKAAVSTASHQAGSKFKAELEQELVVNGAVVAPKGSEVYGTVLESVGGRRIGVQRIVVTFDQIMINGKQVAIKTDEVGAEGGAGGAARKVGAGAIIGSATGDAGKGAAIGAGIALLGGGKHIQVPPESLVKVSIKEQVNLK